MVDKESTLAVWVFLSAAQQSLWRHAKNVLWCVCGNTLGAGVLAEHSLGHCLPPWHGTVSHRSHQHNAFWYSRTISKRKIKKYIYIDTTLQSSTQSSVYHIAHFTRYGESCTRKTTREISKIV